MLQEQDQTLKLISNKHVISFLKMLEIGIDLDDVDESEIEILTDEQISIEPKQEEFSELELIKLSLTPLMVQSEKI